MDKKPDLKKIMEDPIEFANYLLGVDLAKGDSRTVFHWAPFEGGRYKTWYGKVAMHWFPLRPEITYIVTNLKHLDYLVARGVKPSRIILCSELQNDSKITTVAFDEAVEVTDKEVTL